jgi:hypothetical protein
MVFRLLEIPLATSGTVGTWPWRTLDARPKRTTLPPYNDHFPSQISPSLSIFQFVAEPSSGPPLQGGVDMRPLVLSSTETHDSALGGGGGTAKPIRIFGVDFIDRFVQAQNKFIGALETKHCSILHDMGDMATANVKLSGQRGYFPLF